MKLWVDDYRPAPRGWVWAKNVTAAVRMLSSYPGDTAIVSLDHDIKDSSETFMPVAHYLLLLIKYRRSIDCSYSAPIVSVHTGNDVAAEQIRALFADADIVIRRVDAFDIIRERETFGLL